MLAYSRALFIRVGVLMILSFVTLSASKEGILQFNKFSISSDGIGNSGPIVVSGTQTHQGISDLKVNAFRRCYTFTKAQLEQLAGLAVNGMQFSYEHGYQELGGRTIYIMLTMGFTSVRRQTILVTITEHGNISIEKQAVPK